MNAAQRCAALFVLLKGFTDDLFSDMIDLFIWTSCSEEVRGS